MQSDINWYDDKLFLPWTARLHILVRIDSRHEQIKLLVTIDIRSSFFAYGLYFDIYNVSILFPQIWRVMRVVAAEVILIFKSLSECTRMFCDFWWMGGC